MTLKRNTGRELTGKRMWIALVHNCTEERAAKVEAKLAKMSGKDIDILFSTVASDPRAKALRDFGKNGGARLPHRGRFERNEPYREFFDREKDYKAYELFNIIEDYLF